MFISDEVKGNKIIGEAVLNLLFNSEQVTTANLVKELNMMAEIEADEDRLLLMHKTRRWLEGFISVSCREPERAGWLENSEVLANSLSSHFRPVSMQAID